MEKKKKRETIIGVRVNDDEYQILHLAATNEGRDIANYVRHWSLKRAMTK